MEGKIYRSCRLCRFWAATTRREWPLTSGNADWGHVLVYVFSLSRMASEAPDLRVTGPRGAVRAMLRLIGYNDYTAGWNTDAKRCGNQPQESRD